MEHDEDKEATMRKTIVAILAAAAVLVIGGAIGAVAQTDETTTTTDAVGHHRGFGGLLDEMVADGVITDEQSTAIAEWLEARRTEMQAAREEARAAWETAWEDDVLTRDEAQALPFADRILAEDGPFAEAWADDQLTRDEFEAVKAEFPGRRRFGHHHAPLGAVDA